MPGPPDAEGSDRPAPVDPTAADPAEIETQLIGVPQAEEPTAADAATSALDIDHLFGDQQFREYVDEPLIGAIPLPGPRSTRTASPAAAQSRRPVGPISRNQRIAFSVAGGLVAVLVLVLLFVVGTRIGSTSAVTPLATPQTSASATPSAAASDAPTAAAGAASLGQHKWSDLNGGECLDPFTSPFAETFTVVDCSVAHPAQLVVRGEFAADAASGASASPAPGGTPGSSYPGNAALQAQINLLCTAPGVIDLAIAGAYSDIQFQASYPATAAQWDKGDRNYYCFVNRSSGELITGSVAGGAG